MQTDIELLDAWRAGDNAAGSQLFERYVRSLYRFFATKVSGGVDDLIQRVFTACVDSRERIHGGSFRAYLFAVARNELYDHWRGQKRNANLDFSVSSLVDLGPTPSSIVARKAEQELLARALQRIPMELQLAIELYYWEEMSGPELSVALDIPEGTVRSRLRRAREALKETMAELATSTATLQSTIDGLDTWAAGLQACIAAPE